MNRPCQILIVALALVPLFGGCRTFRQSTDKGNVAAARDLTFHGLNALHHGRADHARNLLEQATEACPGDQRIRQHLASAMVEQGQIDQAIEQLKVAIEHSPHDPRMHVELGNLFLLKHQPRRASHHAQIALNISRQTPCAWLLKGRCQTAQGDHEGALSSFHRAAGYEHADIEVQVEIARTYQTLGRPMQALNALEVYNENFSTDQTPMTAILLSADALNDMKQYRRADEKLAAATGREDATPEVWLALSRTRALMNDMSDAILTARQAQNVFPDDPQVAAWTQNLELRAQQGNQSSQTAGLPVSNRY